MREFRGLGSLRLGRLVQRRFCDVKVGERIAFEVRVVLQHRGGEPESSLVESVPKELDSELEGSLGPWGEEGGGQRG